MKLLTGDLSEVVLLCTMAHIHGLIEMKEIDIHMAEGDIHSAKRKLQNLKEEMTELQEEIFQEIDTREKNEREAEH